MLAILDSIAKSYLNPATPNFLLTPVLQLAQGTARYLCGLLTGKKWLLHTIDRTPASHQTNIVLVSIELSGSTLEAITQYAKQYQMIISRWSYNRLIETIRSKALQLGITVESGFQQSRGDPKEQAKDLAVASYRSIVGLVSPLICE